MLRKRSYVPVAQPPFGKLPREKEEPRPTIPLKHVFGFLHELCNDL